MRSLVFCLAIIEYVVLTTTQKIDSTDDQRIVGGKEISITEAPYQVALIYDDYIFCGGVILAPRIILTAAHCYNDSIRLDEMTIRAGSTFHGRGGEVRHMETFRTHPNYDPMTLDYDIAMIKLKKDLVFSENINSIKMKDEGEIIPDGDMMTVTGWGRLEDEGPIPDKLQRVLLPKVPAKECESAYEGTMKITPRMVCSGFRKGGKDSCEGDSGGPAVHEEKLCGLVSFGMRCAFPGFPGIYTKISILRPWINKNMDQMQSRTSKPQKNKKGVSSRPFSSTRKWRS